MSETVFPMIHGPDARGAANWYKASGFEVIRTIAVDGEMDWAKLMFGESEVMFSAGGKSSSEQRRAVDLYNSTTDVDESYRRLEARVEGVEKPHDTFYGMRERILRD